ncbi:MAG TPA: 50S ribosomal protein L35 [Candidatus Paceibacterota bacterium]|nr:50S ribosomal protein L35 [Candidatus Paceibacterota bacterium]
MKKTITTRFRVTKNGKVLHRTMSQCHFRSKKTSNQLRRSSGTSSAASSIIHRINSKPGTL